MSNWLILEDNSVNKSHTTITLGVGIRTVNGDQVGYGYTEDLSPAAMIAAAKTAASLTDRQATAKTLTFAAMDHDNYYPLKNIDPIALDRKLPLVEAIDRRCFEKEQSVVKVSAGFHDSLKRIMIVTSQGNRGRGYDPPQFSLRQSDRPEKTDAMSGVDGCLADGMISLSTPPIRPEKIADEAVKRLLTQFGAVAPPAGEMPVVLGPGITGVLLHEAIGHGLEADFNRKRISTYSDMLGKKVAEPFVTIVDDGTVDHLVGSINFDDEGSPSQKTVLVEKGILTGYMHDKISARHYGTAPTGNGRRQSYAHYPLPRMRNTYMLAGEQAPEDVIRQAQNGIYVEDVTNGQVKIGEGDFAFYVSKGRMIENGRLTAPIKDVNIIGNGPKMLANIVSVAGDLELNKRGGGNCGKAGQWIPIASGPSHLSGKIDDRRRRTPTRRESMRHEDLCQWTMETVMKQGRVRLQGEPYQTSTG